MTKKLPLVLLTHPLPAEWISALNGRVRLLTGPAEPGGFAPELLEKLPEAEGIFSLLTDRVDESILSRAARLRVVSNMAVGVDNVDVAACTRRGIPVGHTPGALTDATADLTMAILLSAARRLTESAKDAREGRWGTWSPTGWLGADLRGASSASLGWGRSGARLRRGRTGLASVWRMPTQPNVQRATRHTFPLKNYCGRVILSACIVRSTNPRAA